MKKRSIKKGASVLSYSTLALVGLSLFGSLAGGKTQHTTIKDKFYPNYSTLDQCLDAAKELDIDIAGEGDVLLKNDGTLPLKGNERISVFGSNSVALVGGGSYSHDALTLPQALREEGFKVNPTLEKHYLDQGNSASSGPMSSGGGITSQANDFNGSVEGSLKEYSDAAIIVLSRDAGEGGDIARITSEEATEEDKAAHRALGTYSKTIKNEDGTESKTSFTAKHTLMLTKEERDLIKKVKGQFDKICVVLNTSNVMEIGELKDDPQINSIINIGRPGEDGLIALARILNGSINPSGHLVDEWPRDLTADPTWENFGDNSQTGSSHRYYYGKDGKLSFNRPQFDDSGNIVQGAISDDWIDLGVDYEEDIYLGYRYYQTYYEDKYNAATNDSERQSAQKWYDDHVAYGFGYGLSYTTFSMNIKGAFKDEELKNALPSQLNGSEFDSKKGKEADIKTLYIPVEVENTGKVSGKQTVQIYVSSPYTKGGIEKASHDLVGYGKTNILQPGERETIVVKVNVQDFASYDYNDKNKDGIKGDYELDQGEYTIRALSSSHRDLSVNAKESKDDDVDEFSFSIQNTAHLRLDDFSNKELSNLFTTDDGKYTCIGKDGKEQVNSLRTADMMQEGENGDPEVLMSRADFDSTFPRHPNEVTVEKDDGTGKEKKNALVFKKEIYDRWQNTDTSRLTHVLDKQVDTSSDGIRVYSALEDKETDPWYMTKAEFDEVAKDYTQAKDKTSRTITLKFKDLNGLDYDDPKYDEFLNQLTWDEITALSTESRASTVALDDFGKPKSIDQDGPNCFDNLYQWCDETVIAATWNTDLGYLDGQIVGSMALLTGNTGWYGPGMDMHRSAFSGRNNEYYSQDGIQGGYMAASVVRGAQEKGCNAMIKHLAFNDQETNRGGQSLYTWQSEQNIRQNELKMFQMAIQEGGAQAGMSGYGRIQGIVNQSNWYLNTGLLQNQWGWHGFMITDGFLGMRWCTTIDQMVRAGNGIVYKTEPWYDLLSGEWDETKRNGKGNVVYKADLTDKNAQYQESYMQYYYARKVAHSVLWATANSNNYQNGFAELALKGGNLGNIKAFESADLNVGLDANLLGNDSFATYSISKGSLPEGLELDEKTGKITGKATKEGDYSFTLSVIIDNYVTKSATYSIKVDSAFSLVKGSDDFADMKVGEEFQAQYESSVFTTEGGKYDSVEYSLKEGTLPEGITLDKTGLISGTPSKAGTFNVTIAVKATKKSSGGGFPFADKGSSIPAPALKADMPGGFPGFGGGDTTTEADFTITLVVKGNEVEEPKEDFSAEIKALKEEIEALKSKGTDTSALESRIASLEGKTPVDYSKDIDELKKEIDALKNKDSSGCSGSLLAASSSVLALGLLGISLCLKKKKEEK